MMCGCDCLNICGDDPDIEGGIVKPCRSFIEREEDAKRRNDLYRFYGVINDNALIDAQANRIKDLLEKRQK